MIKINRYLVSPDFWVLILCLFFLRLPVAFGFRQNPQVRLLFLLPIVAIIVKNLILTFYKPKIQFFSSLFYLSLVYVFILAIGFIRTIFSGRFPTSTILGNFFIWGLFVIFGLTIFITAQDEQTKFYFRRAIFFSINLYFIINIILYLSGFQSNEVLYETLNKAAILRSFGINVNRVLFPTAGGINSFGATAGVGLVASFVILTFPGAQKPDKLISIFGFISSLMIILLTDSRGALAYSFLIISAIILLPRSIYRFLKWIPIVAPLLPLLLLWGIKFLPASVVFALSRTSGDLSNLSNRIGIWNVVLNELYQFKPIHLIGFGYRGQVLSGLSSTYSYLFSSYINAEVASAHNFLLQSIVEVGYLGTIILILFLYIMIGKLAQTARDNLKDYTPKAMLFVLIYLVFSGINEAVFSPDFQEIFVLFWLFWVATGTMNTMIKQPENLRGQLSQSS